MKFKILTLLYLCSCHFHAQAWWAMGHEIVAQIAYSHMTKTAKKKYEDISATKITLIGTESMNDDFKDFVISSLWSDALKSYSLLSPQYQLLNKCHYFDVKIYPDDLDSPISYASWSKRMIEVLKDKSAVTINRCILNFSKVILDKNSPLQHKAIALRFISHLIGDLHQPLHNASFVYAYHKEDFGGTRSLFYEDILSQKLFSDESNFVTNLHAFWDATNAEFKQYNERDSVAALKESQKKGIKEDYLQMVQNSLKRDVNMEEVSKSLQIDNLMQWSYESYDIAQTRIYPNVSPKKTMWQRMKEFFFPNTQLSVVEIKKDKAVEVQNALIVKKQLVVAGRRLALILNTLLDSDFNDSPSFKLNYIKQVKQEPTIQDTLFFKLIDNKTE